MLSELGEAQDTTPGLEGGAPASPATPPLFLCERLAPGPPAAQHRPRAPGLLVTRLLQDAVLSGALSIRSCSAWVPPSSRPHPGLSRGIPPGCASVRLGGLAPSSSSGRCPCPLPERPASRPCPSTPSPLLPSQRAHPAQGHHTAPGAEVTGWSSPPICRSQSQSCGSSDSHSRDRGSELSGCVWHE